MKDQRKTKSQLIQELNELRRRVAALAESAPEGSRPGEALRNAESLLQSMIEHIPIDFWARDLHGRCFAQSRTSVKQWGDLRDKPFDSGELDEETLERWQANNERVLRGEIVCEEVSLVTAAGERREYFNIVAPIIDGGKIKGVLGVNTDITDQKRAQQALRESEETSRALIDAPTESAILLERDGMIVTLNETAAKRFGGTVEGLIGRCVYDFIPPDLAKARREVGEEVFRTGRFAWCEDGQGGRTYRARIYPVLDASGEVSRLAVYAQDVTEQKAAEEAIRHEQRRLRRLLDMHERDRKLVAYEVHDGLIQPLTAALMHLEAALPEVAAEHSGVVPRHLQNALELLRGTLGDTRRLMSGQRPIVLDERGLLIAIEHLVCAEREEAGPEITWSHDVRFDRLASPLETAIFRIVQETVANARRHSRSDRVRIALVQQGDRVRIEVEDWGIGFDPEEVGPDHFGLEGIRERARLFGGHANIDSAAGNGTRIVVQLPVVEAGVEDIETPETDLPPRARSC